MSVTTTTIHPRLATEERRYFFTIHALNRMQEMLVSRSDVLATVRAPEVTYPSSRGGRRLAVRNRLAVVTNQEVIVTVLWHTTEFYARAEILN
jgi:hypothetical protein